jgi:hypothetical protein
MLRKTFKKIRYYDSRTLPYRVQVNPPKPERESNRRRKKKSLAEDFIDITEASSLYMLDYSTSRGGGARAGGTGGRPAPKSGGLSCDSLLNAGAFFITFLQRLQKYL